MRWDKRPQAHGPAEGDIRHRSEFLFFPKTINGKTRWLEHAQWTEKYGRVWTTSFSGSHWYDWVAISWDNE